MITTLHVNVKTDLFLKIDLTTERPSSRKKLDMKEAFQISRAFF